MSSESALRHGHGTDFELIETMRWEPVGGFLRGDLHLARLEASAKALGFGCEPEIVGKSLRRAAVGDAALRVRLALAADGGVDVTTQPFSPLAPDAVWTIRIARTRLDSSNRLLRHKTTRRDAYDRARAEFSREEAEEMILLNQAGNVCEGTITSIFVDAGDTRPLRTPALACGLLAGILRGEMLARGEAVETMLSLDDLIGASRLWVGNSLRGLIAAKLVRG
ncbi:4-amino-4-deoxychorismate lyase [Aminobacter aminovorans]|jgi:4-amino-4-deoxychorismate lyase|uniref:Probable branched-chain-amino-acid aminotransferase n=1 Tax=Aminobacter aminovorans TaxID=83263 RepID=A0A380WIN5_AMIAI|nr:aminotransferase class IV family protein [Aminobacter aminovorans]TCS28764.1 4-amino-4-deoxychorismate lyase [Aminobacter aminovorans]SUU88618.1 Branched-chain amino acid aminotransferase/4-amino-4-deoxychorismate lyase [Aminobacter aminovorans]